MFVLPPHLRLVWDRIVVYREIGRDPFNAGRFFLIGVAGGDVAAEHPECNSMVALRFLAVVVPVDSANVLFGVLFRFL